MLRGKFTQLNANIVTQKKKSKLSSESRKRRAYIKWGKCKLRAEISKTENRKKKEKSTKQRADFLEKVSKTDKSLARITKEKRQKLSISEMKQKIRLQTCRHQKDINVATYLYKK